MYKYFVISMLAALAVNLMGFVNALLLVLILLIVSIVCSLVVEEIN